MPTTDSALDGLRVIDLAHPYGQYAGKLLADIRAKAEKGDAHAQFELGTAFDFGSLTTPDPRDLFVW